MLACDCFKCLYGRMSALKRKVASVTLLKMSDRVESKIVQVI